MILLLLLSILIFLGYLIHERIALERDIETIPLRIAVTGTRGKTGVVRMLTAVLSECGLKVLGKTTGSRACYLLPDGTEADVPRRGIVSILEQKKLIKKAVALKVDCLVSEIMSIQQENHFIESHWLLQPHVLVITNIRSDHTDAMGESEDEIASVLAIAVTTGSTVFLPAEEFRPIFTHITRSLGAHLIWVARELSSSLEDADPGLKRRFFPVHLDLVSAVTTFLSKKTPALEPGKNFPPISQNQVLTGLKKVKKDSGEFSLWKYRVGEKAPAKKIGKASKKTKTYLLANGFAANDPLSTYQLMSRLRGRFPSYPARFIGIMNLRSDRGDRTQQWIESLKTRGAEFFDCIYVTGGHAQVVRRKLKPGGLNIQVLEHRKAENIMEYIITAHQHSTPGNDPNGTNRSIIFGFGNIKGTGTELVDHWQKIGVAIHGI